jgi:hypothetical protein
MITPSYALTATERVLPRMALDFTTASLDSRVTLTRALNTATAVNSSGYIATVNADLPRFDYDPTTLLCKGLLIEESRTNPLLYSNEFTNIVWTATFGAVSLVSGTSPDGSASVYKFIPSAPNASFRELQQNIIVTAGTTYCFSQYVKADNYTFVQIIGSGVAFGTFNVNWDLSTGAETAFTAGTSTVVARGIINAGNGFYRVWAAVTALSTTSGRMAVNYIGTSTAARGAAWVADGVNGYQIYGAQLEAGAFPTSYIPTEATAVTRNADNATMTGTNFSDWYNATEGALQTVSTTISTTQPASTGATLFLDGSNFMATFFGDVNKPRMLVRNANVFDVNTTASVAQSSPFNQVFAYKSGSISFASNATLIVNSVNKPIPTPNVLYIGYYPTVGAAGYANAWISRVAYWPQRLINNEVIAFSK